MAAIASGFLVFAALAGPAGAADFVDLTSAPAADPLPAASETVSSLVRKLPPETPEYFRKSYLSLMRAPLPSKIYSQGGIPRLVPQLEIDPDPLGTIGSFQPHGPTVTSHNAFFQELGTNGRACVTCHQPPSGMSISRRNINERFNRTRGRDPLFAPVDGANCPNLVPAENTSGSLYGGNRGGGRKGRRAAHSLLLTKGLIRIPIPIPAAPEFTIDVVRDPTTCNLTPAYNKVTNQDGSTTRIISVFRRPLISAHLDFKTTTTDFRGVPKADDESGNVMWDGREKSLRTQAVSATLGHAQAIAAPSDEALDQIVKFETNIFSAQYSDRLAGPLFAAGALGGPVLLSEIPPGQPALGTPVFTEFDAWAKDASSRAARRQSIARGQTLFSSRIFQISNVGGFNDLIGASSFPGTCSTCHNVRGGGTDIFQASQRDIGIGGHAQRASCGADGAAANCGPAPANDLPRFKLTCPAGSFLWDPALTEVVTNDPGRALITGKCRDIGRITVPGLRGLASREPYFHDGSASSIPALVQIYDKRFNIGLTPEEEADLANFLLSL